jgi:hypothetical protein
MTEVGKINALLKVVLYTRVKDKTMRDGLETRAQLLIRRILRERAIGSIGRRQELGANQNRKRHRLDVASNQQTHRRVAPNMRAF